MQFDWALVARTLQDPRGVARTLIGQSLPQSIGWLGLALMAVMSGTLTAFSYQIMPSMFDPTMAPLLSNGFEIVALQALVMAVIAMLVQGVGRAFGGQGRFADALVLVAWIEALLLLLQVLQVVFMLVLPPLAFALGLFGVVLFLWLLAAFAAELHGFRSTGRVFFSIIGVFFAISFALAFLSIALMNMKG